MGEQSFGLDLAVHRWVGVARHGGDQLAALVGVVLQRVAPRGGARLGLLAHSLVAHRGRLVGVGLDRLAPRERRARNCPSRIRHVPIRHDRARHLRPLHAQNVHDCPNATLDAYFLFV